MLSIIIRRIFQGLIIILIMTAIVFFGIMQVGNPLDLLVSDTMSSEEIAKIEQSLRLDKPLIVQYLYFLADIFRGNFGNSFITGESAIKMVLDRLPATIDLSICAVLLAVFTGIPAGLYAGVKPHSPLSKGIMSTSVLGFSIPFFWFALIMIILFSVIFPIFPSGRREGVVDFFGYETSLLSLKGLHHLILPAFILSINKMCLLTRLTRASVLEVSSMEYVKFAYAKGVSPILVVKKHILRNVLIPIITVMGNEIGQLIAFSVVVETIFNWPGIGKLLIDSINSLDRPVIMTQLIITTTIFVSINLIVDILYAYLDPRIRDLYRGKTA